MISLLSFRTPAPVVLGANRLDTAHPTSYRSGASTSRGSSLADNEHLFATLVAAQEEPPSPTYPRTGTPMPKRRTDLNWPTVYPSTHPQGIKLNKWILHVRDQGECQIRLPRCTIKALEVDHIIPILAGGMKYDPDNLRASCRECNYDRRSIRRVPHRTHPIEAW